MMRLKGVLFGTAAFMLAFAGSIQAETDEDMSEAVTETAALDEDDIMAEQMKGLYIGIEGYGTDEASRDFIDELSYRFVIDGEERSFKIDGGEPDEDGNRLYPVQNALKEGYEYTLTTDSEGVIVQAEEQPEELLTYDSPVKGTPGELTLTNFLKLAMEPVGTTLYIYGGGWNWQDDAASVQAKCIGISQDWLRFFNEQDASFTYRDQDGDESKKDASSSYYPYGGYNEYYYAGLDCSGYAGWVIYQLLNTEDGNEGYVTFASETAKLLEELGFGKVEKTEAVKPGDVVSLGGHVWISLGTCNDGSIVIAHSTPSDSREGQPGGGVQISAIGDSEECEAYKLADRYMSDFFPEWYSRYPACLKDSETYFKFDKDSLGVFSWDIGADNGISDPDGIQGMGAEQALELIFAD